MFSANCHHHPVGFLTGLLTALSRWTVTGQKHPPQIKPFTEDQSSASLRDHQKLLGNPRTRRHPFA